VIAQEAEKARNEKRNAAVREMVWVSARSPFNSGGKEGACNGSLPDQRSDLPQR
jgi:hypothetical protein